MFFQRRSILLQIALIVIERSVLASSLQGESILYHFVVELLDALMRNDILNDNQAIMVEMANCQLETARVQ